MPTESEIAKYAMELAGKSAAPDMDTPLAVMRICASSPVPQGWIKVNDEWSPISCGRPPRIVGNVWIIESYNDKPVGSVMRVCASAPTPTNWVEINNEWSPTSCGRPSRIVNNVKIIQRVA